MELDAIDRAYLLDVFTHSAVSPSYPSIASRHHCQPWLSPMRSSTLQIAKRSRPATRTRCSQHRLLRNLHPCLSFPLPPQKPSRKKSLVLSKPEDAHGLRVCPNSRRCACAPKGSAVMNVLLHVLLFTSH